MRPNIDENDYQVKMRAMKSFIEEGDKVKVTLRFRGREMAHQDIGVRVLERIRAEMDTTSKVEQMPRMENRQMVMVRRRAALTFPPPDGSLSPAGSGELRQRSFMPDIRSLTLPHALKAVTHLIARRMGSEEGEAAQVADHLGARQSRRP